ncbi:MAG: PEP-CTERM sorting domain-containing protein [Phycisphaera sp.]|nr:PEP-CTERM sorting domain-containing protein [Phycisphaera sp.]
MYGSLSNFDCINDTGQEAHGFEIELDNCSPSDVYSTFGAPYNRYGTPTITTDGTNTFVRYESTYNNGAWAAGTVSGTYSPTGGHSLFNGATPGYPGNIPGDHFGVALSINPSNTVYTWLLDGGGGTLVKAGSSVKIPAPVLKQVAAANPVNPLAVQAVIQAPPPEVGQQLADAIWAKVFITVVENAGPVELDDLVLGNAVVPPETETEIEWILLQDDPANPDRQEKMDEGDVAAGNESITRCYEFYNYIGEYDPENHEALSDAYDPSLVGDYLGNQNVAFNFAAAIPEPATCVLLGALMGCVTMARRRSR